MRAVGCPPFSPNAPISPLPFCTASSPCRHVVRLGSISVRYVFFPLFIPFCAGPPCCRHEKVDEKDLSRFDCRGRVVCQVSRYHCLRMCLHSAHICLVNYGKWFVRLCCVASKRETFLSAIQRFFNPRGRNDILPLSLFSPLFWLSEMKVERVIASGTVHGFCGFWKRDLQWNQLFAMPEAPLRSAEGSSLPFHSTYVSLFLRVAPPQLVDDMCTIRSAH